MRNRTFIGSLLAAALLAISLPAIAAAQGGYPDYRGNRNDNYRRYDERQLRDSIHRLDRLAKEFQREVDRNLDRSRRDGTRAEDRINNEARQFRNAVSDLKSSFGNGRDLNRSRDEAQRVMQEARQLERIGQIRNNRLSSMWSQIRQELNTISNAYGNLGFDNGRNGRGRRDDNDWRRRFPF